MIAPMGNNPKKSKDHANASTAYNHETLMFSINWTNDQLTYVRVLSYAHTILTNQPKMTDVMLGTRLIDLVRKWCDDAKVDSFLWHMSNDVGDWSNVDPKSVAAEVRDALQGDE